MSTRLKQAHALPRRLQIGIVASAVAAVLLLFVALPALQNRLAATAAKPPSSNQSSNTFLATDEQWAGLKIETAEAAPIASWDETDGKIATDDDTATPVFSQYSGRVLRVLAKAGDTVAANDPLVEVDASEFVQGQNDLISAKSQAASAQAQLNLATINEKRLRDMYDSKGAALKDWQQAQADATNAEAQNRTAQIALAAARNRLKILGKSDAEISRLEMLGLDHISNGAKMSAVAIVRAPIGGTIIQRQVGVGQYINSSTSGGQQLFSIGDLSTVWLVAKVRETDAPSIKLGQKLEVKILAFPDKIFEAKVTYISPVIEADTRRLPVRAELANPSGDLKPEMFATFRITTSNEMTAITIPENAIVYEGNLAHVWVAHPDHSIELRPITVGRHADTKTEIVSGLSVGEQVVTKGALFIDRAAKMD